MVLQYFLSFFFFSSRRRHTRLVSDWSSDVCSSDLDCGITGVALVDPAIAVVTDSSTVHATGNGVTHATVAVAGITGQVVIDVNQVPEIGRASCRERV